jgi:phage terminase large subunit-like protein
MRKRMAMHLLQRLATKEARDPSDARKVWRLWATAAQLPPAGDWRIWLLMGGRGSGKTRAGAEWVRSLVESGRAWRVALVGPTLGDVREVMIEGPSGLKAVASEGLRPAFNVSRRRLEWPNGAVGHVFSAEDPDSLRGPQFDAAWCDEIGAWKRDVDTWNMLMFGLRLGAGPRVAATTTPRASKLVMRLAKLAGEAPTIKGYGGVEMTRAATRDNARNLAPGFIEAMEEEYAGTRLGRQELDGELIEDPAGAVFTRAMIEAARVRVDEAGAMERVVVAVDPPAGVGGAACGIVAAGLRASVVYVLRDASARGLRPLEWAERAVATARAVSAGVIVAEANQGGEMVRQMLEMAGARETCRVVLRHAKAGKIDRAQPVSGRYDRGEIKHVGVLRELEDEMCAFGAEGETRSPDRVDALVWAVMELTAKPAVKPAAWMA